MLTADITTAALAMGFLFGLGSIVSIGPQNLRLIETGAAGRNATLVATTGFVSEILIVGLGIDGGGAVLVDNPTLSDALRLAGAAFLLWCGVSAIRRRPAGTAGRASNAPADTRASAVLGMLAVTWLNPLVYVEVMLVVAVMSSGFDDGARAWFATGFLTASALNFYGWSTAGRLLAPALARPGTRRGFDLVSGSVLLGLALLMTKQATAG